MTEPWVYRAPKTQTWIEIDRDKFGELLQQFTPQLDAVAERGAKIAQSALPDSDKRKFIRAISCRDAKGKWTMRMYRGGNNRLMRGVTAPVALVVNDSRLAATWEYGVTPAKGEVYKGRRSKRAMVRVKNDSGDLAQYKPLQAALQQSAGTRNIIKYRPQKAR